MTDLERTNGPPMWKRILAWQLKAQPSGDSVKEAMRAAAIVAAPADEMLLPGFLATEKSGVAVQRELAKMMW